MLLHSSPCVQRCASLQARQPYFAQAILRQHRSTPAQRLSGLTAMASTAQQTFFLDDFARKQFNDSASDYSGTRIYFDLAEFVQRVEQYHQEGRQLVSGYAPFCKHIFVPNFTGAKLGSLAINKDNVKLLKSGYSRRRPEELPVLSR